MSSTKDRRTVVREFGSLMALVALLFAARWIWKHDPHSVYPLSIALFFLFGAWFCQPLISPLEKAWMKFADVLSHVMTFVILTVMYFLVLTPLALIVRLSGKKLLDLRPEPELDSYWIKIDNSKAESRYFRPF